MSVAAWLLELSNGARLALGQLEVLHLLEHPDCYPVPGSPEHCQGVLLWEEEILAVLDPGAWLEGSAMNLLPHLVAVVQFRPGAHEPVQRGALVLGRSPLLIQVDDSQQCELPDHPVGWKHIAAACFRHGDEAIPVVNLERLFAVDLPPANH